jgi:spoIIIJ-associated protein
MAREHAFRGESIDDALAAARAALGASASGGTLRYEIVDGSADAGPVAVNAWVENAPAMLAFETTGTSRERDVGRPRRPARGAASGAGEGHDASERPERPVRPERSERPERPERSERREARPQRALDDSVVGEAQRFLAGILDRMGMGGQVDARLRNDAIQLDLRGAEGAALSPNEDGDPVEALETLVERAMARLVDFPPRVTIDVDSKRSRREESLERMARDLAARARATGKAIAVDPMSPRDRRIMHVALADEEGVRTQSQGEGAFRRLLIIPAAAEGGGEPEDEPLDDGGTP